MNSFDDYACPHCGRRDCLGACLIETDSDPEREEIVAPQPLRLHTLTDQQFASFERDQAA